MWTMSVSYRHFTATSSKKSNFSFILLYVFTLNLCGIISSLIKLDRLVREFYTFKCDSIVAFHCEAFPKKSAECCCPVQTKE